MIESHPSTQEEPSGKQAFPDYVLELNPSHTTELMQKLGVFTPGQEQQEGVKLDKDKLEEIFSEECPISDLESYLYVITEQLRTFNILGPINTCEMYLTRDVLNDSQKAGLKRAMLRFIAEYPLVEKQTAILEVSLQRVKDRPIKQDVREMATEGIRLKKEALEYVQKFFDNADNISKLMSLVGEQMPDFHI